MNELTEPNLSILRRLLRPYENKNNTLAILLWMSNYIAFFFGQYCVVELNNPLKIIGSFIIFISMSRLFILGHDASHESFTSSKKLNYVIAQLSFSPALVTAEGWKQWHNLAHHGFTNLAPRDFWQPLSKKEFDELSLFQKKLQEFYRSSIGICFYYAIEIWWHTYYPLKQNLKGFSFKTKKSFIFEFLAVNLFLIIWFLALFIAAENTNQNYLLIAFYGFFIPFIFWNITMSFVIYLHHTHPNAKWYNENSEWKKHVTQLTDTVHIRFPDWISSLLHHIMEHPAHHINSRIPCYNLKAAQRKLEETYPDYVVVQNFSWRWYLECTRICKLYDFKENKWISFDDS
jgi:omega-6 fatty acid desaturase (delta-12 desaturase)